jgi:hypothetical protein
LSFHVTFLIPESGSTEISSRLTRGTSTRWQMMTVVDDDGLQGWAAGYDGEGRERAARDGGDSGVAMMAAAKMAAAEDSSGG